MNANSLSKLCRNISGKKIDCIGNVFKVVGVQQNDGRPNQVFSVRPDLKQKGVSALCTEVVDGRIVIVEKVRLVAKTSVAEQLAKAKASSEYVCLPMFSGLDKAG